MRLGLTILAAAVALAIPLAAGSVGGAPVTATPGPVAPALGTQIELAGHPDPGRPKNTRRCRKLIRKINRAERQGKYRRMRKLSRKYNRTCRT